MKSQDAPSEIVMAKANSDPSMTRSAFLRTQEEIASFGRLMHEALVELSTKNSIADVETVRKAGILACERLIVRLSLERGDDGRTKDAVAAA